jgi:predicted TPR repeat methyltransferase
MAEVSRARKTAAGKSVYSSVIHGDALQYLATLDRNSQDCILASDVFIYIGDISQVLSESSKCLVDSGIVAFTVESLHDSSEFGLRLLKSGRFGHSKKYIQKVADENGFKLLSWDECVLRQQGGADVNGATVVLVKS